MSTIVAAGVRLYSNDLGLSYLLREASWSSEMNGGMQWSATIPQVPTGQNLANWEGRQWFIEADAPDGQPDWTSPPLVIRQTEVERGLGGRSIRMTGQDLWSYRMETKNQSANTEPAAQSGSVSAYNLITTRWNPSLVDVPVNYHEQRGDVTTPPLIWFRRWHFQLLSAKDHLDKLCGHDAAYWIATGPYRASGIDVYQMEHEYSAGTLYIARSSEAIAHRQDYTKIVARRIVQLSRPGSSNIQREDWEGVQTANLGGAVHGYSIHAVDGFVEGKKFPGRIKWFAFFSQSGGAGRVVRVIYPYAQYAGTFDQWPTGQSSEEPWLDALSYKYHVLPYGGPDYDGAENTDPPGFTVHPQVGGTDDANVQPAEYTYGSGDRVYQFEPRAYRNTGVVVMITGVIPWLLRFANRNYHRVTHECRFDPWVQPGGAVAAYDNFPAIRVDRVEYSLQGGSAGMSVTGFKLAPS